MDKLFQKYFSLTPVDITRLNGYDNVNYLVTTGKEKYILKSYKPDPVTMTLLEAEHKVLLSLQKENDGRYPKPIAFTDGCYIKIIENEGEKYIWRLLTFLEGEFLGGVAHTKTMFRSLGKFLAEMDLVLQQLHHPAIEQRVWKWDIQHLYLNEKYIDDIPQNIDKNIVRHFFRQYDKHVVPVLPELRKQIIHNDANEWNVLTQNGVVSGIIDFGDLSYTPLINELAIALTYACFDKTNPLEWAIPVIKAYNQILPLEEKELNILYYLIASRLTQSVCNAAYAGKNMPENEHAFVSEEKAWKMLYLWSEIDPEKARKIFLSTTKK
jgi:Ser/Thr protein kinase RdoA (MazF antagonist)